MSIMIPLWYAICFGVAGAYFGFWFGRSRNWGLMETGAYFESEDLNGGNKRNIIKGSARQGGYERTGGKWLGSPAGGMTEMTEEGDQKGVRILTTESKLYAPESGRILKISPRGNAFLLHTDWDGEVWVKACCSEDDLLDRYFRPRVVQGEIVRRGKLLLEYDRNILCKLCDDTAVYVTMNQENTDFLFMQEGARVCCGEDLMQVDIVNTI